MGLNLIYGPANSGKTGEVYSRYKGKVLQNENPLLVLPTQADVFRASKELSGELNSMIGASLMTFGNLFSHVVSLYSGQPKIIDHVQRVVLLKKTLAETKLNVLSRSSRQAGFLKSITKSIKTIMATGLSPADLNQVLKGNDPIDLHILEELTKIYAGYVENLKNHRFVEKEQLGFQAEHVLQDVSLNRELFVHKFEEFSPAEKKFIETYANNNDVTVSYTHDETKPFFANDPVWKWLSKNAGSDSLELNPEEENYSERTLYLIEKNLFSKGKTGTIDSDGGLNFLTAAGIHNEVELVGSEIAKLVKGPGIKSFKPHEIAVIVREASYQPEISRIFKGYDLPVSIDKVCTVRETSFGRTFLSLYEGLITGSKNALLTFLGSDFSRISNREFYTLERAVLSGKKSGKDLLGILFKDGMIKEAAAKVRSRSLDEVLSGLEALSAYVIEGYLINTKTNTLTGDEVPALNLTATAAVIEALVSLKRVIKTDAVSLYHDWKEITDMLSQLPLRIKQKPEEGRIQVLSPAQAVGRRFKVVFIMGLNEGSYPKRQPYDPFMPNSHGKFFGNPSFDALATAESESLKEMRLFYMMITRARNAIYCSYCVSDDTGSPRLRSYYLDELLDLFTDRAKTAIQSRTSKKELKDIVFRRLEDCPNGYEIQRKIALDGAGAYQGIPEDISDKLVLAKQKSKNGGALSNRLPPDIILQILDARKEISITEMQAYVECRYKWFATRVLGIKPLFEQFSKASVGQLFHKIAALLYQPVKSHINDLGELPVTEMLKQAEHLVDEELEAANFSKTESLLVREMLLLLIRNTLISDQKRGGTFLPELFEHKFGLDSQEFSSFSPEESGGLNLSGRIDRVDICKETKKAIVYDYKTGSPPASFQPESYFQIVLYTLAIQEAILKIKGASMAGAAFQYSKVDTNRAVMFEGSVIPGLIADKRNFEELLEPTLLTLKRAAQALGEGDISANAKDCQYCELDLVCRRKAN